MNHSNNSNSRHAHSVRFARVLAPFVAGASLAGAIALLAAAQQGGSNDEPKVGSSREFRGPPPQTVPGEDTSFKGPPPQSGAGQMPAGTGYNNPGGMVDSQALQDAAAHGGIHYHVHYHGQPGQAAMPGYAPTQYVSPDSVPAGGMAQYYMPGYGPGNPGPLGSESGLDTNPAKASGAYTGFTGYGAYGNYLGGPGGYFGGGGGVYPSAMAANAAYANAGYVSGFND